LVDFDAPSWLLADPRKAISDLVNALEHLALAVADRPVLMDTEIRTGDVEREACHVSDWRASGRMPAGFDLEVFRVGRQLSTRRKPSHVCHVVAEVVDK